MLPKDLKPGERRPVVVCQHGLEGRPHDVIAGDNRPIIDSPSKLAEQGFITFAPQNPYIFDDRFRTLAAEGQPAEEDALLDHRAAASADRRLAGTLPFVDRERIAFYGLSYGGKSAMRIPPLVTDYCLSICSADFNEWVWKNASTRSPYSYVGTRRIRDLRVRPGQHVQLRRDGGPIAPRPFMVERGHFDGVASDEAWPTSMPRFAASMRPKLGIGDRTEIEFFVGPHTIHGKGTFEFLHKHLRWP